MPTIDSSGEIDIKCENLGEVRVEFVDCLPLLNEPGDRQGFVLSEVSSSRVPINKTTQETLMMKRSIVTVAITIYLVKYFRVFLGNGICRHGLPREQ